MNNIALYKISKFSYEEAFVQSQLDMAGSQQNKILEKMAKNKKYMKTQNIIMKLVIGIFIAVLTFIPIQAFINIQRAMGEGIIPTNYLIFAGSMTLSVSFLIQILYLIMFGMFFASSLLSGEYLKWLSTLPIALKNLRKITMMTFFRGMDVQFVAILLVLPIGTAIITQSVTLTLLSLFLSLINIIFAFSLLVIIGEKVHRIMNNNDINSRKSSIARIIVMMSYLICTMGLSLGLNYGMEYISKLFTEATLSNISVENVNLFNMIFSLIPLPFTAGFTLVEALIGYRVVSGTLIISSIIGLVLFIGLTLILLKKALNLLTNVFVQKSKSFNENAKKSSLNDVKIEIDTPVKAFFKKDKHMITRDIQMMMMVIMPILLPFIGLASSGLMGGESEEGLIITFAMNMMFMVLSGVMIVWGLLNVESTGATIHASLPICVRDQVNAKVRWIFLILTVSSILQVIFIIGKEDFAKYLVLTLLFYPIGPITALITLELKVRLFGKTKYKYIIEDVHINHRVIKWIFIIFIAIVIFFGTFYMIILSNSLTFGIGRLALVLLSIEAGMAVILYSFYNKMFPKLKIYDSTLRR